MKTIVNTQIKDQQLQKLISDMNSSNKSLFYRSVKTEFHFETYLDLLPNKYRKYMTKIRLSNHKIPIEKGRWSNTPRNERICPHCPNTTLGDEFHYIFECKIFKTAREKFIDKYYYKNPSVYKSTALFCSQNKKTLLNLSKLLELIIKYHE